MDNRKHELEKIKEKAYKKKKGMPWYGVNVTHRISIRIVGVIQGLELPPDLITFFSIILGLIGAFLFCIPREGAYLAGALFIELYYVFDAVDGQYARLRGKTSVTGAYFDYISNHIVQSLMFLGMGSGLFRLTGDPLFAVAGFLAAWGMVFMYVIHDAQASILLQNRGGAQARSKEINKSRKRYSLPKGIFMAAHKTGTFPTTMNIMTLFAIISIVVDKGLILFRFAVLYYAIILNTIWIAKLFQNIRNKKLDIIHKGG
jgi:phosphatidylglycerophosphate synthase